MVTIAMSGMETRRGRPVAKQMYEEQDSLEFIKLYIA